MKKQKDLQRRTFLKSAMVATGMIVMPSAFSISQQTPSQNENINLIGPMQGYSPQIGTLVSMMNWMRFVILKPVKGMTMDQLDYIHDDKANSIGSMLLHLAATERFYQIHTFENKKWGDWSEKDKTRFETAMNLGDEGRKAIKGNSLDFYLNTLNEVRETSLKEFKMRDDKWLLKADQDWPWGPTNNYCKWFHVCEHESNHNGQIKWIKGRLPGAGSSND
jgi:hypothetical protein